MGKAINTAKAIMIQGTGSGVGKSVIVAALCRIFKQAGYKVAPFKAQNMALNSFVTKDGLEIGRAQAYQAEAAGIEPKAEMNPVLLKPSGDNHSQVVVMGQPIGNFKAKSYYALFDWLKEVVIEAYHRLAQECEIIVIEGAGSPAEVNLKEHDLVNMNMGKWAKAPVIIVGDIDRGGVFAWMKGTFDLLTKEEQTLVKGFLINKFRGDITLLKSGIKMFETMVNRPILGVIPYFKLYVDEEDGVPVETMKAHFEKDKVNIGVLALPRMQNFTDFAALALDPVVNLSYVRHTYELEVLDALIIPGSKNVIGDLIYLEKEGFKTAIYDFASSGKPVSGICGGFQMLGEVIYDPWGVEGNISVQEGLGLLPMETSLETDKITRQVILSLQPNYIFPQGGVVKGYEIHMGRSTMKGKAIPLFEEDEDCTLGLMAEKWTVLGTYIHGFLDNDNIRSQFIRFLCQKKGLPYKKGFNYKEFREKQLNKLANLVRNSINMDKVYEFVFKGI